MDAKCRLDYQPLFGKMSPHSFPLSLRGGSRPDPGDGGNRAYAKWRWKPHISSLLKKLCYILSVFNRISYAR